MPLSYLLKLLQKSRPATVAFTNGCFDLLHEGHVASLEAAKEEADILVVGLNSDDSVRRLKGPGRPIMCGPSRALILAALECVDYVVWFCEDTPIGLIKAIRPDVLVKSNKDGQGPIVGQEFVESYGGHVVLTPAVEGISTTVLIRQIMEGASA